MITEDYEPTAAELNHELHLDWKRNKVPRPDNDTWRQRNQEKAEQKMIDFFEFRLADPPK